MADAKKLTFYDPHPGFLGAVVPLPAPMKEIIDKVNGMVMSLEEAIEFLTPVSDKIGGNLEVVEEYNYISFRIKDGPIEHGYRLIRYREF